MQVYFICKQNYEEDGKTKDGDVEYLTIDNGWSELIEYGAIFTHVHADYVADKYQRSIKDYCADFFILEN